MSTSYGDLFSITKTYLYNFDPLKPHFYIVKLGFTGVYIIFVISAQNIDCEYSLNRLDEAVLTSTNNLCLEQKYEKYQNFYMKNCHALVVKFSVYLNRRVFVILLIFISTSGTFTCHDLSVSVEIRFRGS